jgi:DNA-binding CsgD family transcriptional regulator
MFLVKKLNNTMELHLQLVAGEFEDKFTEARQCWHLEKLYEELNTAKQRLGTHKRKQLTPTERACLRGLISGYSPSEIAMTLNREPNGLRVDLSRGLYRYIEVLMNCPLKDWNQAARWLASNGYSLQSVAVSEQSKLFTINPYQIKPEIMPTSVPNLESAEIRWVGREPLIQQLSHRLQADCRILTLVGITGIGKSALAAQLALEPHLGQQFSLLKAVSFDAQSPNFISVASQILGQQGQQQISPLDSSQLINDVIANLQSKPCLLILDMLEAALETDAGGIPKFRDPTLAQFLDQVVRAEVMPSRILLTSQDRPPVIAEGRYGKRTYLHRLQGLNITEALELFAQWSVLVIAPQDLEILHLIIHRHEGHPLSLRAIATEIQAYPYNGNIQAYWHDYGLDSYGSIALTDLVNRRVRRTLERLRQSSPLAYRLLCKGTAFQQAVEQSAWLILIADAPPILRRQAFQTLQRHCLLETEQSEEYVLYRLHSLIWSIAIELISNLEQES